MNIVKDKILVSLTLHMQANTVDIAWANRVLEDGNVIASNPDRGAYPLDSDGEPIGVDTTAIGAKLSQLLGNAGAHAQSRVAALTFDLDAAKAALSESHETIVSLNAQIDQLKGEIQSLRESPNDND